MNLIKVHKKGNYGITKYMRCVYACFRKDFKVLTVNGGNYVL